MKIQELRISSTRVWIDDGGEYIVGYYTLLPTVVREGESTGIWRRLKPSKQFWGKEVYGVLIGKIALDESLRGLGYGIEIFGEAIYSARR